MQGLAVAATGVTQDEDLSGAGIAGELSVGVSRGAAGQDGVAYFWSLSAGLTLMNSLSQL